MLLDWVMMDPCDDLAGRAISCSYPAANPVCTVNLDRFVAKVFFSQQLRDEIGNKVCGVTFFRSLFDSTRCSPLALASLLALSMGCFSVPLVLLVFLIVSLSVSNFLLSSFLKFFSLN